MNKKMQKKVESGEPLLASSVLTAHSTPQAQEVAALRGAVGTVPTKEQQNAVASLREEGLLWPGPVDAVEASGRYGKQPPLHLDLVDHVDADFSASVLAISADASRQ